jgi:hypothetical protein
VSGYYRDGKWLTAVVGGYRESAEEAERAVAEAVRRVEAGETTARNEVKELLTNYPSLKLDRENHPLKALMGHYAREVLR